MLFYFMSLTNNTERVAPQTRSLSKIQPIANPLTGLAPKYPTPYPPHADSLPF